MRAPAGSGSKSERGGRPLSTCNLRMFVCKYVQCKTVN